MNSRQRIGLVLLIILSSSRTNDFADWITSILVFVASLLVFVD